jgi:glutathione S-transferase
MFPVLTAFTDDEKKGAITKVLDAFKAFGAALVGPYAVGDQFTLADIAFIPIIERIITLGGHYAGLVVPVSEEYKKFHSC